MTFIKNNARLLIGICVSMAVGLSLGFLIGLNASTGKAVEPQSEPETNTEQVGSMGEKSVLPQTQVCIRYIFALCGHEKETTQLNGPYTGMSEKELTSSLEGDNIVEFTSERVLIERYKSTYCPDHFMLTLNDDGKLCIAHTDSENLETQNTQVLSYDVSALPNEAILLLEEGMVFDELEQINLFLEDMES